MRNIQKVVCGIWLVLALATVLYTPVRQHAKGYPSHIYWSDRHFLFAMKPMASIAVDRVAMELIASSAVCGVVFFMSMRKRKEGETDG